MINCYIIGNRSSIGLFTSNNPSGARYVLVGYSSELTTAFKQIVYCKPDLIVIDTSQVHLSQEEIALLKQRALVVMVSEDDKINQMLSLSDHEMIVHKQEVQTPDDKKPDTLLIKTSKKGTYGLTSVLIHFSDIIYIESQRNYVHIHTISGQFHRMHIPLNEIGKTLPSQFIKANRSYIINSDKITAIEGEDHIILNNNEKNKIAINQDCKEKLEAWKQRNRFVTPDKDRNGLQLLGVLLCFLCNFAGAEYANYLY